ncbi:PorP/SprF family type IX secretion system membrane protein [Tenacibaculum sp. M341]|uniref:PorP/SprF family type IX secretion system membrane protein n=1 Tax=Tenacibaculum sp. M341 TaxID=2530339 RepID=UPI00104C9FC0|nr:type IX secretion system membrane protein PorP/SprF [Tenacibaculum sp. M341]TCI93175.1 type IX secretion system membrane protein PorP/SprF [Tenacibaculum sp. M341]
MEKKLIDRGLLLFLLLIVKLISAQQDPHYTYYMYNTMSVNPAYAGSNDHTVITVLGRTQWIGLDGAPDSQTLSYETPLGYTGVGLGVNLTNDRIGPANEIYLDTNVSYRVRTSDEGNLAFGLKLGVRHLGINWNKGTPQQQERGFQGTISRLLPTIGAGVYFYKTKWYVGLAIPNLLRTDHYDDTVGTSAFGSGDVAQERLHFFGIFGYVFDLSETIKFKPAALVKLVNGAPASMDISANFLIEEKFSIGVAWRWDDSISALLGIQATKNLNIGLAYDVTTSNYSNYNSGTYEIMLRWDIFRQYILKSPRFF